MMKLFTNLFTKLFLLGVIVGVLFGCDDSEPEPDPIIGTWILDDVMVSDAPAGFVLGNEGESSDLFGEDEYSIRFFEDMTYERELDGIFLTNGGDVEDEGEYSLDEDFLELIPDTDSEIQGLGYEFDLEEPVNEKDLVLSYTSSYTSFNDDDLFAILDSVESITTFDSLLAIHGQLISVKVSLHFDKD